MVIETKINNFKVKPVDIPTLQIQNIGGGELFPELYPNVAVISRKKTGKTTIVKNILDKCANKETHVWIFCPSFSKDASYKEIMKSLEKRKIKYNCFYNIEDEEEGPILNEIIEQLRREVDEEPTEYKPTEKKGKGPYINWGGISEEKRIALEEKEKEREEKEQKKKEEMELKKSKRKIYPEHIIVLDDLGKDLSKRVIGKMCKTNRHLKMLTIMCAHDVVDIARDARKNIDIALVSASLNENRLESLYQDFNISKPWEEFLSLYEYATKKSKYDYLYINIRDDSFRINFNRTIDI